MQPSRRTQPYRRAGGREPGLALQMMLAGKPGFMPNPMDMERETMRRRRGGLGALLLSLPRR